MENYTTLSGFCHSEQLNHSQIKVTTNLQNENQMVKAETRFQGQIVAIQVSVNNVVSILSQKAN